jgi:2-dehydropantoate 2-reductase
MMSSHSVFGAGLIGGFIAGVLRSREFPVSLVVREKMKSRFSGELFLSDYNDHKATASGFTFAEPTDSPADFLWLTVKCTAVKDALEGVRPFVNSETIILCCQNGLGSDLSVRDAFPDNVVLRVMFHSNVAQLSDDRLHRGSEGDMIIEYHPKAEALAERLNCPLMPTHVSNIMDAVLWAKLQLNVANAVNALADIPVKSMLEQRGYRQVIALLMTELLQVVKAQDITLPKLTALPPQVLPWFIAMPNWLFNIVGTKMMAIDPSVRTSMWWDLSGGRLTEVDHLNGAVVMTGEKFGVACPANQRISDLIHAVERGELKQGMDATQLLSLIRE